MDDFTLDFTELGAQDRPGFGLQALIEEIGRRLGYDVEKGGVGPDKGRDLFFLVPAETISQKTERFKWLVSCKDFSVSDKSVGCSDITGITERVLEHNCHGLLLVLTTLPTNDLVAQLSSFEKSNSPFATQIWDKHAVSKILKEGAGDKFRFALAHFFPKSCGLQTAAGRTLQQVFKLFEQLYTADHSSTEIIQSALNLAEGLEDEFLEWSTFDWLFSKYQPPIDNVVSLIPHVFAWKDGQAIDNFTGSIFYHLNDELSDWFGKEITKRLPEGALLNEDWVDVSVSHCETDSKSDEVVLKLSGYGEARIKYQFSKFVNFTGKLHLKASGKKFVIDCIDWEEPSWWEKRV